MKPTDLNFKVLTPTPERARKLLAALARVNIRYAKYATEPAAVAVEKGHFSFWHPRVVSTFDNDPLPELTFTEALELLAQVEAPTPTFDIKLRDEVLCRDGSEGTWEIKVFARLTDLHLFMTYDSFYRQLIPFKGNEHLHGKTTMPDGWWEVEDGQPVWRRE